MKRLFLFLLFTLQAGVLFAQGDNTISMVTYFPVPYVAYNRVKATKQMDIGLSAKPASLVLGTASTSAPLTVSGTTTVTGGALSLNFADSVTNKRLSISAPSGANAGIISLGTPNQSDMANLTFKNLTVGEIALPAGQFPAKNGVAVSSINTDELVVSGLKLFGSDFPDCSAVNPTNGNGQIAWKQLALGPNKNSKSVYLTCGGTQTCGLLTRADCETREPCVVDSNFMYGLQNGQMGKSFSAWLTEQEQNTGTPMQQIFHQSGVGALQAVLDGTYGGSDWEYRVVMCGIQVKQCDCEVDYNPPRWVWGGAMDYSRCSASRVRKTRVFKSCSDYLAEMNSHVTDGYTVIGDVIEIETVNRLNTGECSSSVNLDFSNCKAYKFDWGNKVLYQGNDYTPNYVFNDRFHYATWLSHAGGCYFTWGNHAICTPPELYNNSCDEGYENADVVCNRNGWLRNRKRYSRQKDSQSPKVTATCHAGCQSNHNQYAPDYYEIPMRSDYSFSGTMGGIDVQKCNRYEEPCTKVCKQINVATNGNVTLSALDSNQCPLNL